MTDRGQRVAQFLIVEKLGEGGMGVVYKADDERLRRTVALKLLPASFAADEERRKRFLREARSAAAVTHANIATIYDVGEADGRVYIAMEYVEGRTVRRLLKDGALVVPEALRIAKGIARGLAKAHEKGIVHRDLKPDNVMVNDEGEIKILDFGLAKLHDASNASETDSRLQNEETASQVTAEGRVLGTPGYMSPEQSKGREVDPRSDVFSFGVVLYEILTGERPFKGETTLDVLISVTRDTPVPVSKLNGAVPPALERIIDRCLAKAPGDRYANARELAGALDAATTTTASAQTAASNDAAPATRVPRGRWRAWIVGVAIVVVAAVPGGILLRKLRAGSNASGGGSAGGSASGSGGAGGSAGAGAGVAMTELAAPKASNAEALAAYAAGMQSLRDASLQTANASFHRAVTLDPNFAAAHVQIGAADYSDSEDARRSLAIASQFRSGLSERDAAILDVARIEVAADVPDYEADWQRWKALAEKYPLDFQILVFSSIRAFQAGHEALALEALDRASALDPKSAWPAKERAEHLDLLGDDEGARAAVDRCLEISPAAATCFRMRAKGEARTGQCDKVEADARRMIAVEPDKSLAYTWLANALVSQNAPFESVEQALRLARDFAFDPEAKAAQGTFVQALAPWMRGDFAALLPAFGGFEDMRRNARVESLAAGVTRVELEVLEEIGDDRRALAIADDYVRRLPGLTHDSPLAARPAVLAVRHRGGHITDAEFRATRDSWTKAARAKLDANSVNCEWFAFYASVARTAADAEDALKALPAYTPLPKNCGHLEHDGRGDLGRVYLLAGRIDEAIPPLRDAARACFMPITLVDHIRNNEMLGEALEKKADKPGACAAYAEVLARWGDAKPRSITADAARAGQKRLGCGK